MARHFSALLCPGHTAGRVFLTPRSVTLCFLAREIKVLAVLPPQHLSQQPSAFTACWNFSGNLLEVQNLRWHRRAVPSRPFRGAAWASVFLKLPRKGRWKVSAGS